MRLAPARSRLFRASFPDRTGVHAGTCMAQARPHAHRWQVLHSSVGTYATTRRVRVNVVASGPSTLLRVSKLLCYNVFMWQCQIHSNLYVQSQTCMHICEVKRN